MTPEQKAAFIIAQASMMEVEKMVMIAEDRERERHGNSPANGPTQWAEFRDKWEAILGYNAVLYFFNREFDY